MNKSTEDNLYLWETTATCPTEEMKDLYPHEDIELTKRKDKRKPKSERKLYKMRTFSKSSKLDNVCYDIRGPVRTIANER